MTQSRLLLTFALLCSCITGGVTQNAGVGAVYTTRCSARMVVKGNEYLADCTPPVCDAQFTEASENHVVVAIDPGEKLVGYRERVCLQDLHNAAKLFQPVLDEPVDEPEATPEEGAPE
jgi:hypothetical protein